MNCRHFQNYLFEYLDASLSRQTRAAADRHLSHCEPCRVALRQQQQMSQTLAQRFHSDTDAMTLGADAQRRILAAVAQRRGCDTTRWSLAAFWSWRAWFAGALACLVFAVWFMTEPRVGKPSLPIAVAEPVSMDVSNDVPAYVFRREGQFVIDSISYQPRVDIRAPWFARD